MAVHQIANSSVVNGGQVLTAGINGTSYTSAWTNTQSKFNDGNSPVMTIPHGSKTVILEEKATLEVKGIVKINGINLEERLNTIEKVLNIPTRDAIMESKYPKLANLYKQYMQELEKYKTFERLKGDDTTTP